MGKIIIPVFILMFLSVLSAADDDLILENAILKAGFNPESGVLENLTCSETTWQIQRRPELGQSFVLYVPMPGQRFNPVYGNKQKVSNIRKQGNKIDITWKNIRSEKGGILDIEFRGTVELTGDGLIYSAEIVNKSPYVIETVTWPYLGDLSVPAGADRLHQIGMRYGGMTKLQLYPKFDNQPGYFSVDYPEQTLSTPYTLFSLIDAGTQGLYAGYLDTTAEHMVKFAARLLPGYTSYELWDTGVNPPSDQISGHPVHLEFSLVHFPFINPGEKTNLHPVMLRPYQGSWHKGADFYRKWRSSRIRTPAKPAWLGEVHAWQQIHMNNPEDDIRYMYKDLVRIGKDCAKHGVKAIQVTGWTLGGQDEGNPSHDIDPRLGSFEDLQSAIAEVQKLNIKIVLFTKFTWADRTTDWYKNELIDYAVKTPYGEPWFHSGYAYQTPTQLSGINTHPFAPLCHLSAAWRMIAEKEFVKALQLNADGMLYDENQHHGGAHYCFDGTHGHHVPAHIFAGDYLLGSGFDEIRRDRKPDFIFAGEGHYDLEYRHYQLSYFRVDLNHVPIHRYVAPEEEMMIVVAGYNDRNMINLALMNRYIISYEPRNFKGRLDEFPLTVAYGKKVDALRKRYKDYLWQGSFRDTLGAAVKVDSEVHPNYTVFENLQTGKRAVVVTNYDYHRAIQAEARLEGKNEDLWFVTPENHEPRLYNGCMEIPANSVAIILEK